MVEKNKMRVIPIDSSSRTAQEIDAAITESVHQFVVSFGIGVSYFFKLLLQRPLIAISLIFGLLWLCYYATVNNWVYDVVYQPDAFLTWERVRWICEARAEVIALWWLAFFGTLGLFVLGITSQMIAHKYRQIFLSTKLVDGRGKTPALIKKRRLDKYRIELEFATNGIGIQRFKEKKDDLESSFNQAIESFNHGKTMSRVRIVLSKHRLPELVTFDEVSKEKPLADASFYVGHSVQGVLTQDIRQLPHMLIAGSTGSGKSVFFKQVLMGLLQSTENLQLYCIDLKAGLEMNCFKRLPNSYVVKNLSLAVGLMSSIEDEMRRRFKFLEQNGLREIVPERDGFDRIVLSIDESSMLTGKLPKTHRDYDNNVKAGEILDNLCKLSRAAAIHIVLATQKVDKTVLPTQVSENISGRMAFKANSVAGSTQVIHTKEAADLPQIKGRGIWLVGTTKHIVQGPFLSEDRLDVLLSQLVEEFQAGDRKLRQKIIHELAANKDTSPSRLKQTIKRKDSDE